MASRPAGVKAAGGPAGPPGPAGDYSISPLSDVDRDADGRKAVLVRSEDGQPASRTSKPELVFDRFGNQDFLRAIRLPEDTGAVLTASESELQAVRAHKG